MTPTKPTAANQPDPNAGLADLRILIVEDVGLIAMELQSTLNQLKCRIAGVAARINEAAALAETLECDGALLDLNLAGQESYPVAAILERRNIPFILISGYERSHLRAKYATAALLQKPFGHDDLFAMMRRTFLQR